MILAAVYAANYEAAVDLDEDFVLSYKWVDLSWLFAEFLKTPLLSLEELEKKKELLK